jgi:hypothetical protein
MDDATSPRQHTTQGAAARKVPLLLPPPRSCTPGETSAGFDDRPTSPRSEARGFMASVSGYVSSTEGAGGAKMRRPGWWRGPAVTSWTQYRIERDKLPPGCSPLLVQTTFVSLPCTLILIACEYPLTLDSFRTVLWVPLLWPYPTFLQFVILHVGQSYCFPLAGVSEYKQWAPGRCPDAQAPLALSQPLAGKSQECLAPHELLARQRAP